MFFNFVIELRMGNENGINEFVDWNEAKKQIQKSIS